jgi:membrane protein DedA with SNARE-associated domain
MYTVDCRRSTHLQIGCIRVLEPIGDWQAAMFGILSRHSFSAIWLAVLLEELGIPMPIPSDLLIVFAGVAAAHSAARLGFAFCGIALASALGSSGLYLIVQRGGCPLIERFGRYIHLGPARLARAEALLRHGGWGRIALGRAIPGLRYLTVIVCGLLSVPYRRYVTAHLAGSSVYIGGLLALGALFGPTILDAIHLPRVALRLIWLLALAAGLPALLAWLARRRSGPTAAPTAWHNIGAMLLVSIVGTTALAASWATASAIAQLLGRADTLDATYVLAGWLLGRGLRATSAYALIYTALLLLCVSMGTLYDSYLLPRLAPRGTTRLRQALGLALLGLLLVIILFASLLAFNRSTPLARWWQAGGPALLATLVLGMLSYAVTTVYGRRVALTIIAATRQGATIGDNAELPEPHMRTESSRP